MLKLRIWHKQVSHRSPSMMAAQPVRRRRGPVRREGAACFPNPASCFTGELSERERGRAGRSLLATKRNCHGHLREGLGSRTKRPSMLSFFQPHESIYRIYREEAKQCTCTSVLLMLAKHGNATNIQPEKWWVNHGKLWPECNRGALIKLCLRRLFNDTKKCSWYKIKVKRIRKPNHLISFTSVCSLEQIPKVRFKHTKMAMTIFLRMGDKQGIVKEKQFVKVEQIAKLPFSTNNWEITGCLGQRRKIGELVRCMLWGKWWSNVCEPPDYLPHFKRSIKNSPETVPVHQKN